MTGDKERAAAPIASGLAVPGTTEAMGVAPEAAIDHGLA